MPSAFGEIKQLHAGGVFSIKPSRLFRDARGQSLESRRASDFRKLFGKGVEFVQTNFSYSQPYVVRGMHYQLGWPPCAKLIRCVQGAIFQVSVDVRTGSDTLGKWSSVLLDSMSHESVFVPAGFANGFMSLGRGAIVCYEMTAEFDEKLERGFRYNDGEVGIKWPVESGVTVSQKDRDAPSFRDTELWDDSVNAYLHDVYVQPTLPNDKDTRDDNTT